MAERYLLIATLTIVDHLTLDEAKELALRARGEGKRSEVLTPEQAKERGLLGPMQDLEIRK